MLRGDAAYLQNWSDGAGIVCWAFLVPSGSGADNGDDCEANDGHGLWPLWAGHFSSPLYLLCKETFCCVGSGSQKLNVLRQICRSLWAAPERRASSCLAWSVEYVLERSCLCVWMSSWSPQMSFFCPLPALCRSGRSYRWRRAKEGRSCVRSPSMSSPSPAWFGRSTSSSTEQRRKSNKVSTDWDAHTNIDVTLLLLLSVFDVIHSRMSPSYPCIVFNDAPAWLVLFQHCVYWIGWNILSDWNICWRNSLAEAPWASKARTDV